MAVNKLTKKLIGATAGIAMMASSAFAADKPEVTIRYGDNITGMEMWVELLDELGVNATAINNLPIANCVSIIKDGEEHYRVSSKLVDSGQMAALASSVALEEEIAAKSDCLDDILVASIEN